MSRELTTAVDEEIVKQLVSPVILYEGEFDGGTLRLWTGMGELTWNGETWIGRGDLLAIDAIEETTEIVANGIKVSLNGQSSALVAVALGQCRMGFRGTLWVAFLTAAGAVIDGPVQIFEGLLDVPTIQRNGDNSIISVSYESRLVGLTQANEIRYTPEDQKQRFPGDTGFDWVGGLQDASIDW